MADHGLTQKTEAEEPAPRRSRRLTYAAEIRQDLKRRILTGELKPGERLGEIATAEEYDTSQGPVREALAALRQEGLVVRLGRSGTFVSPISMDDAFAAYETRLRIEPHVAVKAMSMMSEAAFESLRLDLSGMYEAAAAQDLPAFVEHDMAFHGRLYDACGTEVYKRVWETLRGFVQKFNSIFGSELFDRTELEQLAEGHATLLRLLEGGDADALKDEIGQHLQEIWDRIERLPPEGVSNPLD